MVISVDVLSKEITSLGHSCGATALLQQHRLLSSSQHAVATFRCRIFQVSDSGGRVNVSPDRVPKVVIKLTAIKPRLCTANAAIGKKCQYIISTNILSGELASKVGAVSGQAETPISTGDGRQDKNTYIKTNSCSVYITIQHSSLSVGLPYSVDHAVLRLCLWDLGPRAEGPADVNTTGGVYLADVHAGVSAEYSGPAASSVVFAKRKCE
jgi:hypothetical protein